VDGCAEDSGREEKEGETMKLKLELHDKFMLEYLIQIPFAITFVMGGLSYMLFGGGGLNEYIVGIFLWILGVLFTTFAGGCLYGYLHARILNENFREEKP